MPTNSTSMPGPTRSVRRRCSQLLIAPCRAFQQQEAEWRQVETERINVAVRGYRLGEHDTGVSDIAAAVRTAVAVDDFVVCAGRRNTDAVAVAWNRREVENGDDELSCRRAAQKGDDTVLVIIAVDPVESVRLEVHFVQRRFPCIDAIEILDESSETAVQRIVQQVPVETE